MRVRFDGQKNWQRRRRCELGQQGNPGLPGIPVAVAGDFAEYRKRSTTFAVQLLDPFEVETTEGVMAGKAGDYLAIGAAGEMYPIDREIFQATYEGATA